MKLHCCTGAHTTNAEFSWYSPPVYTLQLLCVHLDRKFPLICDVDYGTATVSAVASGGMW